MILPIICDNSDCGLVWFSGAISAGTGSVLIGNKFGPCPSCGGVGSMPDLKLSPAGAILFSLSQYRRVVSAMEQIRSAIRGGATPDEITEQIESDSELSKVLGGFIPKDWNDLKNLMAVIAMIIAGILWTQEQADPPPDEDGIVLPENIVEALCEHMRPSSPDDTHTSSKGEPSPPKEEAQESD